LNRRGS